MPDKHETMLAGLCAGLAEEFALPPNLVRLVVLVCALLPTAVTYLVLAWLADRRRVRPVRYGGAGASVASPVLAPVVQRLRALDGRLSSMEAFVASRDFALHKGFRDMRS